MRSLWTAATAMKAQQLNIDTISNNLANVNTTSYKAQRLEFKDLMYEALKRSNLSDDGGRPVNLEVGHGVMPVATTRSFGQGNIMPTNGTFDLGIDGKGFFEVILPNGEKRYTRDGSFKLSIEDDEKKLVTSNGYYLASEDDSDIIISNDLEDITIDEMGNITGRDEEGAIVDIARIKFVTFMNPEGLLSDGQNLYKATGASGETNALDGEEMTSKIKQGYLETSNVEIVEEMVKMITAQRAYEISSKSIQASEEMMQLTNNLKR
ncbi:flagellar basal-body rod protein FlgG [Abyssisolibacter fermentans]|uniref:flagellar basal-body rod protein FlgG n=1 Tax=Abyssisolibacter fermentans TaxID=1766203 RepID=UPI00082CBFC9|nr:flagellar basal-body rod protein FlgG [Abyssisolibacter fermentans]